MPDFGSGGVASLPHADPVVHRQGWCRQDDRRGRDRGTDRGRWSAHDRVVDRSRALARPTRSTSRSATSRRPIATRLWGQQLNARVRFEEAWDDVRVLHGRRARLGRRRRGRSRGARRRPGSRRGVRARRHQAVRDERRIRRSSSSTARRPPRRSGCSRCPTSSPGTWTACSRRNGALTKLDATDPRPRHEPPDRRRSGVRRDPPLLRPPRRRSRPARPTATSRAHASS